MKTLRDWSIAFFVALVLLSQTAQPAHAEVSIAPTFVALSSKTGFGSVTLQNLGTEPVHYKVNLPAQWRDAMIVSPSQLTLNPGVPRVVRFKLRSPDTAWFDAEPRVLFEQVLETQIPGVVQIRVNMSLPFRKEGEPGAH
ncbi:MAG TPA: hypothetical protein VFV57_04590 [Limnobacter sp.]|nr:hypothetical protein [Limnobacter sp.]